MKDDPIVAEVRRVRDALWQEAGCDLHRLAELSRQTAATLPRLGPRLENADALLRYAEQQAHATPALHEEPPPYGEDQKQ